MRLLPERQPDGTDSLQALRDAAAAALNGLPQSLLCHLCGADASGFEALVRLEAVELDGRPHLLAQVRDLTRLRQAEQELEASEQRLRQLLDNTPSLVLIRDLDGRYIYVNRRFCEMYGKQAGRHDRLAQQRPAAARGDRCGERQHGACAGRPRSDGVRGGGCSWAASA